MILPDKVSDRASHIAWRRYRAWEAALALRRYFCERGLPLDNYNLSSGPNGVVTLDILDSALIGKIADHLYNHNTTSPDLSLLAIKEAYGVGIRVTNVGIRVTPSRTSEKGHV